MLHCFCYTGDPTTNLGKLYRMLSAILMIQQTYIVVDLGYYKKLLCHKNL